MIGYSGQSKERETPKKDPGARWQMNCEEEKQRLRCAGPPWEAEEDGKFKASLGNLMSQR